MDDEPFGKVLRKVRRAQDVTQEELAERMGIASRRICDYERGRFSPNLYTIRRLASALEVPAARLLEEEE